MFYGDFKNRSPYLGVIINFLCHSFFLSIFNFHLLFKHLPLCVVLLIAADNDELSGMQFLCTFDFRLLTFDLFDASCGIGLVEDEAEPFGRVRLVAIWTYQLLVLYVSWSYRVAIS